MPDTEYIERMAKKLRDEGKPIEAGWTEFRFAALALNAPAGQVDAMRSSFFCGARYLFGSILEALDPEPDMIDAHRVELLHEELMNFVREFELKHGMMRGRA